jgi:hypothetical protein
MGCFLARGVPISPVVTPREYLDAVDHALDSLSHERERRGAAYEQALEDLVGGRAVRAVCVFSSLLERRPDDPTLHRMIGISYFRAGNARLAVLHLTTALMLLGRATTPAHLLLQSLRTFEASVVRHPHGGLRTTAIVRHPLPVGAESTLAWSVHFPARLSASVLGAGRKRLQPAAPDLLGPRPCLLIW